MRMVVCMCIVIIEALCSTVWAAGGTDAQIKEVIRRSMRVVDDAEVSEAQKRYAISLCDGCTNRFVGLMKDMVGQSSQDDAMMLIQDIGQYGSSNDVSFLATWATNGCFSVLAVKSLINLVGVTSNVVDYAKLALRDVRIQSRDRDDLCILVWKKSMISATEPTVGDYARGSMYEYILSGDNSPRWIDKNICSIDSRYRYSRRRVAALQAAVQRESSEYQQSYITNALNVLLTLPVGQLYD